MNLKQTVLKFFPWAKANLESNPESNPELSTTEPEPNPTPQPPVTMSFYAAKPKKLPGRRTPAGSR